VFGVVQHALDTAGFTDVTVRSPQGDAECVTGDVPTMLDIVRANRPQLFETPIRVTQNAHADDVMAVSTQDPDNLGIAKTVYGTEEAVVVEAVAEEVPEIDDFAERVEEEF
jgi:hypothetical protein